MLIDGCHVLESSLGLTIGGLLIKTIEKACDRYCTVPEIKEIVHEAAEEMEREQFKRGAVS